jgi:hypothetical protein
LDDFTKLSWQIDKDLQLEATVVIYNSAISACEKGKTWHHAAI